MAVQKSFSVEDKLKALFSVQALDSKLDKLRAVRGELPMEVSDLEDELAGLQTRITNISNEIVEINDKIKGNTERIKDSQALIKKYTEQLNNVKNNREFDALNKEIELQGLEILAAEKRINDLNRQVEEKNAMTVDVSSSLEGRVLDLEHKKAELTEIVAETEKEESHLLAERIEVEKHVEEKLLKAYDRIRINVKNGIAVAPILRSSCGGCFAKMPPQLEADIKSYKKIVICEHCGRVLVDAKLAGIEEEVIDETEKPKARRRLGSAVVAKKEDEE
jgi:predicted  nucleic acid-binding Zn-ribbon protein